MNVVRSTIISPNAGLVAYSLLACVALVCAVITAAKGRWGWFALGLLTGLLWIGGALQPAIPGSLWTRVAGRVKARSRRRAGLLSDSDEGPRRKT